jgi:hypothetical protein
MVAVQDAGPYLFELTHEDTKIEYIPGGLDGAPRLSYSGPMGRYSFEGDEIQTHNSARGLEVSVTLDRVSHLRTITLTFFVPDIELDDAGELSFRTVGIHASRRRTLSARLGAALRSEPLEFEGLVRNLDHQKAGATTLL